MNSLSEAIAFADWKFSPINSWLTTCLLSEIPCQAANALNGFKQFFLMRNYLCKFVESCISQCYNF